MAVSTVLLVAGSATFSTRDVWDGYYAGLSAHDVNVIPYPTFSLRKILSIDQIGNDIIGRAFDIRTKIDAVIFVDGLLFRGRMSWVPNSIRQRGLPTVLIGTDDPYVDVSEIASLYTYRFSNEIESSGAGVHYLPTATLPPPQWEPTPHRYDIVFVGTVFEDRWPLIKQLAEYCEQSQQRLLVAGNFLAGTIADDDVDDAEFNYVTFRKQTIAAAEKWQIYQEAKVVLNIFRESEHSAHSPSPRVFEVTALGGPALLTGPPRREVSNIFGDTVYEFDDFASLQQQLASALEDDAGRTERVNQAKRIATSEHRYTHRARQLLDTLNHALERDTETNSSAARLTWVIGCGRTGSTWLNEMLGELPGIQGWHEPYFGRLFQHPHQKPEELRRPASFYYAGFHETFCQSLRSAFLQMAYERFPHCREDALVIKEVNTPELYPFLRTLFPDCRVIWLIRDPFDVLDSYLDLSKPGSWNKNFVEQQAGRGRDNHIAKMATQIRDSFKLSKACFFKFPEPQRLLLRYEDLLDDPAAGLAQCLNLMQRDAEPAQLDRAIIKYGFDQYHETGQLAFRRFGKAGIWKTSGNFDSSVLRIANENLGALRTELGY